MVGLILVLLIILWFLGFIQIPVFAIANPVLFVFNGQNITLFNILVLILIAWAIGLLPSPFWEIAMLILILWLLSILGIVVITGLPNILIIALILSLIFYLLAR